MVLSVEEKKERHREANRKYREKNKEYHKKWRENNKEKIIEYRQTDIGKKNNRISKWNQRGLKETNEFIDEIYNMWLTQEECNVCGVELTRTGGNCSTDSTMDHDHITGKFRHIICRTCNIQDSWKKYFII